jgi:hypothetical protein
VEIVMQSTQAEIVGAGAEPCIDYLSGISSCKWCGEFVWPSITTPRYFCNDACRKKYDRAWESLKIESKRTHVLRVIRIGSKATSMTLESQPVHVEVQDHLAENYHRAKPLNLRKKLPSAKMTVVTADEVVKEMITKPRHEWRRKKK